MEEAVASGLLGPERQAFVSAALANLAGGDAETVTRRLLAIEVVQVALGCDDEASEPAYKIVRWTGTREPGDRRETRPAQPCARR